MLTNLKATHVTIKPIESESNRNAWTNAWNPDVPIKEL